MEDEMNAPAKFEWTVLIKENLENLVSDQIGHILQLLQWDRQSAEGTASLRSWANRGFGTFARLIRTEDMILIKLFYKPKKLTATSQA